LEKAPHFSNLRQFEESTMSLSDQPPVPEGAIVPKVSPPSPALLETQARGHANSSPRIEPVNFVSFSPPPYTGMGSAAGPGTRVADASGTAGTRSDASDTRQEMGFNASAAADLPKGVKVLVQYSDQAQPAFSVRQENGQVEQVNPPTPDIIIGRDGKIHQMTDLSKGVHQNIVIQVERVPGQPSTAEEKEALNRYVQKDLPGVLQKNSDMSQIAQQNVQLNDANQLVTSQARQALSDVSREPGPDLSQQTQQRMSQMDRAIPQGTERGVMSGEKARSFYPDVQQQEGDNDTTYAEKKMLGGLYSDTQKPYEHIATRSNHSYQVGAYGATFNSFSHYVKFAMTPAILEKLGHPPDWSKLGEILKDLQEKDPEAYKDYLKKVAAAEKSGKIDSDLAKRLVPGKDGKLDNVQHLGEFIDKLQGGKGQITAAELKENMSSKTQEAMASSLIKEYKHMGANASKIALAVGLDKTPKELTAEDLKTTKAQALSQSANKFYKLARATQHAGNDDAVEFQVSGDPASPMGYTLAKHFMDHAKSATPGGKCAGGLQLSLADAGLGKWCGSGEAWTMANKMLQSGEFVAIDAKYARPGDIVAKHHASGGGGHIEGIASVTRSGFQLGSDFHHTKQDLNYTNGGYYNKTLILRYVGPNGAQRDGSPTSNA
jgi:hypothetical protein